MLCYGHMRWQYLAGHQGQKAREAQPCSAANFHFGHRQTGGGWRQFLMKSTSGIKHISEKLNLFGTVFDPIFVFLGPGPPSQWWYWREIYGHFHSQGRWTCLVKLILWRTTATSPSFPRCQVQDRPRTELLMLLRGWKLGKLIFQSRKFGFSQMQICTE